MAEDKKVETTEDKKPEAVQVAPNVQVTVQSTPVNPTPNLDETISGGKYVKDGYLVNAKGEYIDAEGNKVDKPVKA